MKSVTQSVYSLESAIFNAGSPGRFLVSVVRSIANGRLQSFTVDPDGDYVNSQPEGVIVSPVPHRTDYRKLRARVSDYWFVGYAPKQGDVVLDVGAGIGEDTLVFARCVGAAGRVCSFEAHPKTARCLAKTVQRSGLEQVEVIAAAVSDRPGTVAIADQEEHVRNSLFAARDQRTVEVPAITLDNFVEQRGIGRIDLLKMNIEGAERPALLGFQRNFHRVRNIAIACHDWIADLGHSEGYRTLAFVREFLASRGFVLTQRSFDERPWIRDTLTGTRKT